MLAARGWSFMLILQQYYQEPDGHLRFAHLAGYNYGGYFRKLPVQTTKTDIKTIDVSKTDESKTDESKTDESKTDDSKSTDSKSDDSSTTNE